MRKLVLAAMAATALTAFSAPAFAQEIGELTVTGHGYSNGELKNISEAVSYADLDLTLKSDRDILKTRVSNTADRLCKDLNDPPGAAERAGVTCQSVAVREAMAQVKIAVADAPDRMAMEAAAMPMDSSSSMAMSEPAPAAVAYSEPASATVTTTTVTNGPVADTRENRMKYGAPMSNAGKRTAPAGN